MSAPGSGPRAGGWTAWLERRLNLTELWSFVTHFGLVYTPVDASRPLAEATRDLGARPVVSYVTWPRVLGLLATVAFALQGVTGVLLAFYYQPTSGTAFETTRTIVRDVPLGWFVHQMHAWGAWLLVAVIAARLVRLFVDGLWRAPRELLWLAAVALTWLALQFEFTGRLLAWNSGSYWSVVRGTEVVFALPLVGPVLAFLLGGHAVNDGMLIRFYVLHVVVLPLAFAGALYVTFATVRRVGLSGADLPATPRTTYRGHRVRLAELVLVLLGVLVTLAVLLPFRFQPGADPYTTPAGVRPPWYMLAAYAAERGIGLPPWAGGIVLVAIAFAVPLLPFLWRDESPAGGRRLRLAGLALLALWVAFSVYGALLDRR